jgi:hypothetical protein
MTDGHHGHHHHQSQRSPATQAATGRSFAGAHSLASEHGAKLHHHHHAGGGAAVLDIGGDVGALVATLDPAAVGTELFLRPAADPSTTVHTGVWNRSAAGVPVTAAVFPELPAGNYAVLDDHGAAVRTVDIAGGAVVEIDLR